MFRQSKTKMHDVTLMIKMAGTACNMHCAYCYEHFQDVRHNVGAISSAQDVINYLRDYIEAETVFILFHGGEPLLADYSEVEKCLFYIKANFSKFKVQFQTNGTLLNDEWINLFRQFEPNISLSISLDPAGEADLRCAPTFDYRQRVCRNIKRYAGAIQNVGVISVAHKFNCRAFEEFMDELIEYGIKSLTINKIKVSSQLSEYGISEMRYVELLKRVAIRWIEQQLYKKIRIQPLCALLSDEPNRICIYVPNDLRRG